MSENNLTPNEKAGLLAIKDKFSCNSLDAKFYKLLETLDVPDITDLNEGVRKAIAKFIPEYWDRLQRELLTTGFYDYTVIISAMTLALLKGYELGRRMQRPLTAGSDKP